MGQSPDNLNALKKCPLFSRLEVVDLLSLERIAHRKKYKKQEVIFSDGELARGFYVVISGKVKIFKLSPDGKEQTLHIFSPGQTFAEAAVFCGETYPAFAQSLTESENFYFPKNDFVSLISSHPQLALNMIATLSSLLRNFNQLVEELSLKEVSARMAKYFLDAAIKSGQKSPEGIKVKLDTSKVQLAARLGTVIETFSRTLAKMKNKGIIEVDHHTIVILDYRQLEEIAAGEKL